jgi:UDP-N-acetylmuramoyl-tripeptide--D-alanyl-D-alanine ligase
MLTLPVSTLIEVTGGELLTGAETTMVNGLAIDSHKVDPGAAFVAFVGARDDGHRFVPDALSAGARAIVVTRDDETVRAAIADSRRADVALIRVDDAIAAVQALAMYHRGRLMCPVIGVTGSTGKTTTKDFLRAVIGTRMRVVATADNRNNELGVPLTIMEAGADTEVLVLEMAMRGRHQIERLCEIAMPTAGLVTNVGVSHVEIVGSIEQIASAKGELVRAIQPTGRVFLNGDDAWSERLAEDSVAEVVYYGLGDTCSVRAVDVEIDEDGNPGFELVSPSGAVKVGLSVPGRHNVYNALAAAAVGLYLGLPLEAIAEGLARTEFSPMRMETFVSATQITVINDAYNANPTSMRAAISALGDVTAAGARVAVLGDMAELGSLTELAHFQLGEEVAASRVNALVTVGPRAKRIADGALADEASEVLDDLLRSGDVVLVKASRVMGLEAIVEGIIDPRVQPSS